MIETERLLLRRWKESDREPFARMNADPLVMEFLGPLLSREQTGALIEHAENHFDKHGFGPYAVELRETGEFAGFVGISVPTFQAHFTPCVEIGWRLKSESWGRGYATEGARRVVRHAFFEIGLNNLVSFTAEANLRSRRVMDKLGMSHVEEDDFDHPRVPAGSPLRRHVLYRLEKERPPAV